MQIKKNYTFLALFIVAAASVLILLPLRVYQYFTILEPETGFYSAKDASVYVMYAVMACVSVFSIVFSAVKRKELSLKTPALFGKVGCAAYAVAALAFAADIFAKAKVAIDLFKAQTQSFAVSPLKQFSSDGGVIIVLELVFAVGSVFFFASLAASSFRGSDSVPTLKYAALFVPLWAVVRLLFRFRQTISFINVSDLFLEIIAITFMMLFLYNFASYICAVTSSSMIWKLYAYGFPAIVFSLACFIPRAVMLLTGQSDHLMSDHQAELCDLLLPIMMFVFLSSNATGKAAAPKSNIGEDK